MDSNDRSRLTFRPNGTCILTHDVPKYLLTLCDLNLSETRNYCWIPSGASTTGTISDYIHTAKTYDKAQKACTNIGGRILMAKSQAEHDYIASRSYSIYLITICIYLIIRSARCYIQVQISPKDHICTTILSTYNISMHAEFYPELAILESASHYYTQPLLHINICNNDNYCILLWINILVFRYSLFLFPGWLLSLYGWDCLVIMI